VKNLGRLFRRLTLSLRPTTLVYVDEYVGPSRHEWNEKLLAVAQTMLLDAPAEARLRDRIDPPIEMADPSEAIRSSEIRTFLRIFLDIEEWRPYGGQVTGLVVPHLDRDWLRAPDGIRFLQTLLEAEESQMEVDPESSNHLVAVGRVRSRPRSVVAVARHALVELRRRRSGAGDEVALAKAASRAHIRGCPR
jgi:hypothetical protein